MFQLAFHELVAPPSMAILLQVPDSIHVCIMAVTSSATAGSRDGRMTISFRVVLPLVVYAGLLTSFVLFRAYLCTHQPGLCIRCPENPEHPVSEQYYARHRHRPSDTLDAESGNMQKSDNSVEKVVRPENSALFRRLLEASKTATRNRNDNR